MEGGRRRKDRAGPLDGPRGDSDPTRHSFRITRALEVTPHNRYRPGGLGRQTGGLVRGLERTCCQRGRATSNTRQIWGFIPDTTKLISRIGCRTASRPPWPEGAWSTREGPAMPTVDLTPRLARESRPGDKDTILFDRSTPGFGLRIHPSGRSASLAGGLYGCRARQVTAPRSATHGRQSRGHVGRESALGRQIARAPEAQYDGGLRSPRRPASSRGGGEGGERDLRRNDRL